METIYIDIDCVEWHGVDSNLIDLLISFNFNYTQKAHD